MELSNNSAASPRVAFDWIMRRFSPHSPISRNGNRPNDQARITEFDSDKLGMDKFGSLGR
jgi:hypothetical protein